MAPKVDPRIAARNAQIVDDRRHGRASLGMLAEQHGVSRERIRQICAEEGHRRLHDLHPDLTREQIEQLVKAEADAANLAYSKSKADAAFDKADEYAAAILMRWIAGENPPDIAKSIGMQAKSVQEVLDEQVTDEVLAARARNHTAKHFPDAVDGPRERVTPRNDRRWTKERVFDALVKLAQEKGRLPSSTQYQKIAPAREDLPSFATVRNRLGRWSSVRVEVHRAMRA